MIGQPPDPTKASASADEEPRKRIFDKVLLPALATITSALVLAFLTTITGFVHETVPHWLHTLANAWLLTTCVVIVIFAVGFVAGAAHAVEIGAYMMKAAYYSLTHRATPKRGWWHSPLDLLAFVGMWTTLALFTARMKAENQGQHQSEHKSEQSLRTEVAQLRSENEALRAELKRQASSQRADKQPDPKPGLDIQRLREIKPNAREQHAQSSGGQPE